MLTNKHSEVISPYHCNACSKHTGRTSYTVYTKLILQYTSNWQLKIATDCKTCLRVVRFQFRALQCHLSYTLHGVLYTWCSVNRTVYSVRVQSFQRLYANLSQLQAQISFTWIFMTSNYNQRHYTSRSTQLLSHATVAAIIAATPCIQHK